MGGGGREGVYTICSYTFQSFSAEIIIIIGNFSLLTAILFKTSARSRNVGLVIIKNIGC